MSHWTRARYDRFTRLRLIHWLQANDAHAVGLSGQSTRGQLLDASGKKIASAQKLRTGPAAMDYEWLIEWVYPGRVTTKGKK